jgi:hypothetical protein
MMTKRFFRSYSTRSIVDKWFNALESSTHKEQQSKLSKCIEYSLQQNESHYSNFVKDIIHRWAIEQPTKEALWTYEANNNEYQKLTFNDLYKQSSHFADILTGKEFNLTSGKRVYNLNYRIYIKENLFLLHRYSLFYHILQKNGY